MNAHAPTGKLAPAPSRDIVPRAHLHQIPALHQPPERRFQLVPLRPFGMQFALQMLQIRLTVRKLQNVLQQRGVFHVPIIDRMMKSLLAFVLAAGAAFSAQIPRPAPELAIHMPDGSQKLLSSYRGKTVVLAFVFTTCPHCQRMMGTLGGIQNEYAAKGVQVLASAFNDNSDHEIAGFAATYVNGFPAGWDNKLTVLQFLQHPNDPQHPYFVPILVFIDKRGIIRQQVIGDETIFARSRNERPRQHRCDLEGAGQTTSSTKKR